MSTTDPRPSPEAPATLPASLTASGAVIDLTDYSRATPVGLTEHLRVKFERRGGYALEAFERAQGLARR